MDRILQNRRILVLVSGGIAIYKTLDLISVLKKEGAEVRVVMSQNAMKFITPLSFEAMSRNAVLCENSEILNNGINGESWDSQNPINHISYATWAEVAIFAPLSVNSAAKLRYGIADTLPIATLLAANCPMLLAPSANVNMIESPQSVENLTALAKMGYTIIPTRTTRLACNIVANGAMAEVCEIIFYIKKVFVADCSGFWRGKEVVITGGGSVEQIDLVRHISNNSSGKQASNLALALYFMGARVTLISSKFPILLPLGIRQISVKSTIDYQNALNHAKDSILIMAAAISDYRPKNPAKRKLKKSEIGKSWNLELYENLNILENADFATKIAFKAESDEKNAIKNAKATLKKCDIVILNLVSENPIGGDENEVLVIDKNSEVKIPKSDKFSISLKIVEILGSKLAKIHKVGKNKG